MRPMWLFGKREFDSWSEMTIERVEVVDSQEKGNIVECDGLVVS